MENSVNILNSSKKKTVIKYRLVAIDIELQDKIKKHIDDVHPKYTSMKHFIEVLVYDYFKSKEQ